MNALSDDAQRYKLSTLSVNGNDKPLIGYADQFPEYLLQLKTPEEFIKQLTENGIFNVELDKTFNNRLRRFNIYWDRIKNIQGIHLPWAVLRIFIIVALAHSKFDILILDEPTFGLGWNQRKKLRLFLRECMTNIHFIIVSHDQLFIQSICDQILDLDNKLLVEPVIFCPTVTDKNELVGGLKKLISEQLNQIVTKSITDEILSDELKKIVRSYIKKSIGLKPLTYIEIVRI